MAGTQTDLLSFFLQLATEKTMKLENVRHFVLDECDKMLENLGMHCLPPALLAEDTSSTKYSC